MNSEDNVKNTIAFWIKINPKYEDYFINGINGAVRGFINICEILAQESLLYDKYLTDFIDGLALLRIYLITKDEKHEEEAERLMKPVLDFITEHVISNEYTKFLIDKEISGEAKATIDDVTVPISQREILLHIGRSKLVALTPKDIADVERDWLRYKRQQYRITQEEKIGLPQVELKPKFNPEEIETIHNLLKDFFSKEHQQQLRTIMELGSVVSSKLIFLSNGNRLADAFKQLIKANLITGVEQKELETWIQKNFCYIYRKKVKEFTPKYLSEIISTKKLIPEKNAILNLKKDKVTGKYSIIKA